MKYLKSLSFIVVATFLFTGCGQQVEPPLYYWGNYVKSSSDFALNGEQKEVFEKHKVELEKIIEQSKVENKRVAPGIYSEYAQILYQMNKKTEAKNYFILEKETYPESKVFIDRVLSKLYEGV